MRAAKYSDEQKIASQRYSSIKSRVSYDLEKHWSRNDFIKWYVEEAKECCYCKTSSEDLIKFYNSNESKRKSTRGKSLEIERIEDKPYAKDNCKLCCYWCNNAKSDIFSFSEFQSIGKAIGTAIKEKVEKTVLTHDHL